MTRFDPFALPDDPQQQPSTPEDVEADIRWSSIEAGRRKAGATGAVMAGAMLALRDIYEGPPKELLPIEIETPGEPHDIDRDGVGLVVDGVAVSAPALPRRAPT